MNFQKDAENVVRQLSQILGINISEHTTPKRQRENLFPNPKISKQFKNLNIRDKKMLARLVDALHTKRRSYR
jgi:hypothetical protein